VGRFGGFTAASGNWFGDARNDLLAAIAISKNCISVFAACLRIGGLWITTTAGIGGRIFPGNVRTLGRSLFFKKQYRRVYHTEVCVLTNRAV